MPNADQVVPIHLRPVYEKDDEIATPLQVCVNSK